MKLTKQQYIEALIVILNNAKDLPQEVRETIQYTVDSFNKNKRSVQISDIQDTISFLESETDIKFEDFAGEKEDKEPPTENKPKVLPKAKEETQTTEETPQADTPQVNNDILDQFPETLKSEKLKTILKVRNDLKTIQDVAKAYNNDEDIVLAMYWTKRHLQQYADSYDPMGINPNKPTEFENDLDLVEITYANDLVVTGSSLYSYIPHILLPKDFQIYDNNLRYVNGCEFQIYEVAELED